MRRYANRYRGMMDYQDPAPSFQPPQMPSQLDPKDERLLELSAEVGNLHGQNDLLVEDNGRLEDEIREIKKENRELSERNMELETRTSGEIANQATINEIADEVQRNLKERKKSKK